MDRGFPVAINTSELSGVVTHYTTREEIADACGVIIGENGSYMFRYMGSM